MEFPSTANDYLTLAEEIGKDYRLFNTTGELQIIIDNMLDCIKKAKELSNGETK